MKKVIHKITWKARFNWTKKDIIFEVTEEDCYVKNVSNPIAKWMINEPWYRCYNWLKKKYAEITSIEALELSQPIKNEDQYHWDARNPKRLSDGEWLERQR